MNDNVEIIFEDDSILVCRKPGGVPVQTARMDQMDMESILKNHRTQHEEAPEIYVIHRLDQPVEGVMVFAKTKKAASHLSRQIQQNRMDKYYLAVADGVPKPPEGTRCDWLIRDGRSNVSKVVPEKTPGARQARLTYRLLQTVSEQSLLEICLETGRHHQIRVQMAYMGCPLTGDKKYNKNCQNGYLPVGLCSVKLAFLHPDSGRHLEFSMEPEGSAFEPFLLHK